MSADRLKEWELVSTTSSPPPGDPSWAWPDPPGSGSNLVYPVPNTLSFSVAPATPTVLDEGWLPLRRLSARTLDDPNGPWPVAWGPARGYVWTGMGDRLIALAIDALVIALAFGLVGLVEWRYGPGTEQTASAAIGWMAFVALYEPLSWWMLKGTPGQLATHLRVVRAKDGRRLWPHRALWRYMVQLSLISVVVPAVVTVWLLPIAHLVVGRLTGEDGPRNRAIWDRASGSVVVRRRT